MMSAKTALAIVETTPVPATRDEIEHRIDEERAGLDAAIERLMELAEQRDAVLLGDDDAALIAIDEEIASTTRQRDRHGARARKLEGDLVAAEEAERAAELVERYTHVKTVVDEATKLQRERYPVVAKELAEILATIRAADALAMRFERNEELPVGCDPIRMPSSDRHVPYQEKPFRKGGFTPTPLHEVIGELPALDGESAPYWSQK